jgi:alanine dehydrogenase
VRIPADLRARIYLERGYGERFGVRDVDLEGQVAGLLDRDALFARCDIMLIAKPVEADFSSFRDGQVLWGWPHCVQGPAITQSAIDQRLTWIAWEEMHHWKDGTWQGHVFHINNELAGYGSVLHALGLQGLSGHYGPQRKAAVLGFGSVGRGAIHGLHALGYTDVTLFTQRPGEAVACPVPSVKHWQFQGVDEDGTQVVMSEDRKMPMAEALGHFDVVVNATLQDTDNPMMFLRTDEIGALRQGTLLIDVSCDEGMGFEFGRPTGFAEPTYTVGDGRVTYYAVDHSPSHLWQSATHAIGRALLPFLADVMAGPSGWQANETIRRAMDIRDGVIQNPRILRFQGRSESYPHPVLESGPAVG